MLRTAVIALVLTATTSATASAACSQSKLVGPWAMFSSVSSASWNRCDIEVGLDGRFTGTCIGTGRPETGDQVTGRLRLPRTCELTGRINGTKPDGTPHSQRLIGRSAKSVNFIPGIVQFGDLELNLGQHFTMIRK